jgi:hypothetical protein
VTITVANELAFQILNSKRTPINQIETETGKEVIVRGDRRFTRDEVEYTCEDNRGRPVTIARPNTAIPGPRNG